MILSYSPVGFTMGFMIGTRTLKPSIQPVFVGGVIKELLMTELFWLAEVHL
ncbi:hypothetical protein RG963_05520 [Methanosarcina sp. Z-7115]|uniref:Uncharacterized protein n=1 Tax=Methanosarcina baikalica TaxID=3073890 RepID=A0ABU2CZT2_9EURY|nr:hypothetical protein [Methanosarcina sp. Z-7115]MDR7665250.1 hypothetical protein [Methanosarcina sp. Z-7115]